MKKLSLIIIIFISTGLFSIDFSVAGEYGFYFPFGEMQNDLTTIEPMTSLTIRLYATSFENLYFGFSFEWIHHAFFKYIDGVKTFRYNGGLGLSEKWEYDLSHTTPTENFLHLAFVSTIGLRFNPLYIPDIFTGIGLYGNYFSHYVIIRYGLEYNFKVFKIFRVYIKWSNNHPFRYNEDDINTSTRIQQIFKFDFPSGLFMNLTLGLEIKF